MIDGLLQVGWGQPRDTAAPLDHRRFLVSSDSLSLLVRVADIYGGVPAPTGGPPDGPTYGLVLDVDEIAVEVATMRIAEADPDTGEILSADLGPWRRFELWTAGDCRRVCDAGVLEAMAGTPCQCPADPSESFEAAATGQACRPVIRFLAVLHAAATPVHAPPVLLAELCAFQLDPDGPDLADLAGTTITLGLPAP